MKISVLLMIAMDTLLLKMAVVVVAALAAVDSMTLQTFSLKFSAAPLAAVALKTCLAVVDAVTRLADSQVAIYVMI